MEKYEPLKFEKELLKFWKDKKIYEKQKAKGRKGPKFYWICGPPYTSGKFHVGHFMNYASLKDPLFRYKRMQGFDVWDRGGWDMHGLPTEKKVTAKLGITSKEEIEKMGIANFIEECEKFSVETMKKMTEDYVKWAVWYDHENAYQPITNEFMDGVWWAIRKAHESGYLYEGDRVMAWCPESETVAAKHELEYQEVTDDSIFLKFKLKNKKDEYLIVWTTTPWTIPHNLGVMVNPDIDYVKAKNGKETWILAKDRIEAFSKIVDKELKVLETFKGKEMVGWEYEPFLADEIPELKKLKSEYVWAFKVVSSSEYVNTEEGTGLVHMAPGCGPEDQEVGKAHDLPAFNEVDTKGYFSEKMGVFKGWRARFDDKRFIEHFEKLGALVAKQKYRHEYPHHERSKCAVIFRTTRQWFLGVEALKDQMREWNRDVKWIPEWAGSNTFDNWLANLKDIGLSRQRYWGTPVPIWKCEACSHYEVVGSLAELKKLSGKNVKKMHKPWIDEVTIKCPKCKAAMYRIPDICDVWVDAGCTSWISLYYPQTDKYMKKYWPCDFILEAKDQIRGWFNLLFDTAALTGLGKPFNSCYMTGWILDPEGRKQSKSLGNVIDPYEVTEKYGVDAVRYYLMGAAQPGIDVNYNFDDLAAKSRNLAILWNINNWLLDLAKTNKVRRFDSKPKLAAEEKYILSKLNKTIRTVTDMFDSYKLNEIPNVIEEFYLELSRNYIKMVRDKAMLGDDSEQYAVAHTVYTCMMDVLKMIGTIIPFAGEKMYHALKEQFRTKESSIHLFDWPKADDKKIDEKLEDEFKIGLNIISSVLAIRDRAKIGVRWPMKKIIVVGDKLVSSTLDTLSYLIKNQCNLKEIEYAAKKPDWINLQVKVNNASLSKKFKQKVPVVVGKLIHTSPEGIKTKLSETGKYEIVVDDDVYELTNEDVYFEEELKPGFLGAEIEGLSIYVDTTADEELLAEGFMREIVRRTQDLRKRAGLKKTDRAAVQINSDPELITGIAKFKEEIEQRTGSKVKMGAGTDTNMDNNDILKIKDRTIAIGLNKR